jgi:hypothetical protein
VAPCAVKVIVVLAHTVVADTLSVTDGDDITLTVVIAGEEKHPLEMPVTV